MRQELLRAARETWARYYHIREGKDLAFCIGRLLLAAGFYPEALEFFGHSLKLYGPEAGTFSNMALCHYQMRKLEEADRLLEQALTLDPALREARAHLFSARQALENLGLPAPPADEKLSDEDLTRRLIARDPLCERVHHRPHEVAGLAILAGFDQIAGRGAGGEPARVRTAD